MKSPFSHSKRIVVTSILLVGCILCSCTAHEKEPISVEETPLVMNVTPTPAVFPYGTTADFITASIIGEPWTHTLPPDEALQNWIADYVARAQPAVFDAPDKVYRIEYIGNTKIHFGDKVMTYFVWFDEDTGLFDSALFDENIELFDIALSEQNDNLQCWKLPYQTENPLMFEIKEKDNELLFTLLPQGKLLQTCRWSNNEGVNTDVELRYTGNLELWVNDTRHIIEKDYYRYGYEGLSYVEVDVPKTRLLHVKGRTSGGQEDMLLLSHQYESNGIGTWEIWQLYRLVDKSLQELGIAPGHENDLATTIELRGDDIVWVFPVLEQELQLSKDDFFWWGENTHKDAVEYVKRAQKSGTLGDIFSLSTSALYIEYAYYWSDRGPRIDEITLWHSISGPVHYFQGIVKVTYDITVDGLIPRRIQKG